MHHCPRLSFLPWSFLSEVQSCGPSRTFVCRVHTWFWGSVAGVSPDLSLLRSPYHALLLLSDEKCLLAELPLDCSPALVRVIKTTSAVKNLQQLAQDADLALLQVVPWGLGTHSGWGRVGVRRAGHLCPAESCWQVVWGRLRL